MQSKEFYTSQLDLQSEILLSFLWSKDQRNENNQAEEKLQLFRNLPLFEYTSSSSTTFWFGNHN